MPAALPTDLCPACLALPAVAPSAWRVIAGEVRCSYRCPACRHGWVTGWWADTLGATRGEAA